jgi:hypothetical protein
MMALSIAELAICRAASRNSSSPKASLPNFNRNHSSKNIRLGFDKYIKRWEKDGRQRRGYQSHLVATNLIRAEN